MPAPCGPPLICVAGQEGKDSCDSGSAESHRDQSRQHLEADRTEWLPTVSHMNAHFSDPFGALAVNASWERSPLASALLSGSTMKKAISAQPPRR